MRPAILLATVAVVSATYRVTDGERDAQHAPSITQLVHRACEGVEFMPENIIAQSPRTLRPVLRLARAAGLTRLTIFDAVRFFWLGIALTTIETTAHASMNGVMFGYQDSELAGLNYMKMGMIMPGIVGLMLGMRGMALAVTEPDNAIGVAIGRSLHSAAALTFLDRPGVVFNGHMTSILMKDMLTQYIPTLLIFLTLIKTFSARVRH